MGSMTIARPSAEPFTYADLEAMPDDGYRRELLDGMLVVSPSPRPAHQRVLRGLFRQLDPTCPDGLEILWAPLDVKLAEDTALIPDLLVARSTDLGERNLSVPPLLVVEILSPSTRGFDLGTKRARYERAGVPSYWVVDPADLTVVAWDLVDGAYVEVARVSGTDSWQATRPFAATITPSRLLEP